MGTRSQRQAVYIQSQDFHGTDDASRQSEAEFLFSEPGSLLPHHFVDHVDRNSLDFREFPYSRHDPCAKYGLSPLWMMDEEQCSDLYILDWYYMSRKEGTSINTGAAIDIESGLLPLQVHQPHDFRRQPFLYGIAEEGSNDESWDNQQHGARSFSQLAASTSAHLFRESEFRHHDQGSMLAQNNTKSHWWARSRPHGDAAHTQESFVEPPDINYHAWNKDDNDYRDDYSERSVDQEEGLDWRIPRRLDRTTFVDEANEGADVSLHFDDVYSRPPGTPPADLDRMGFALWNMMGGLIRTLCCTEKALKVSTIGMNT